MSTRSTIYYHDSGPNGDDPIIHIYNEMIDNEVRMEIRLPYCLVNVPLPADLKEKLGIK